MMTSTQLAGLNSAASAEKTHRAPSRSQIYGLDLLRFAAALLVMLHHFCFAATKFGYTPATYTWLAPYTWAGWVGVEIFFVLSGFIITHTAGRSTPFSFVKNRFIRLYPAAWFCSTITAVVLLVAHRLQPGEALDAWWRAATLFPRGPYIDGSYWTLPVEITFYSIVFLVLLCRGLRHLGTVTSVLGIASTLCWIYITAFFHGWIHPASLGQAFVHFFLTSVWIAPLLLDHGCFFAIGTLLSRILLQRASRLDLLLLAFCAIGGLAEIRFHGRTLMLVFGVHLSLLLPVVLWLAAIAVIFASVRYNASLGEWLGPRGVYWTRLLGLVTYPLYLVHQLVGFVLITWLMRAMTGIHAMLATIALALAGSFGIHLYLEAPAQRLLRKLFFAHPTRVPTTAATLP